MLLQARVIEHDPFLCNLLQGSRSFFHCHYFGCYTSVFRHTFSCSETRRLLSDGLSTAGSNNDQASAASIRHIFILGDESEEKDAGSCT